MPMPEEELKQRLLSENESLRSKLREAEETLDAISKGEVDALFVSGPLGRQVYTLTGADRAYRILFETMNEGAAILSSDGMALFCNAALCAMLRTPHESLTGSSMDRFPAGADDKRLFARLLETGLEKPQKAEIVLRSSDGNQVPCLMSASPFVTEDTAGMCVIFTDLTERKNAEKALQESHDELEQKVSHRTAELRATNERLLQQISAREVTEEALRQSEEKLQLFIEHAPASLAMFDHEMRYLAASRRWISDYGLSNQDILGRRHYEIFPKIPDRWKAAHQRGLEGEVVIADEDHFERADGTIQWLHWAIHPWHTVQGIIGGIIIFSEDITDRKKAEEKLRASEELLRISFEEANIGMCFVGLDGQLLRVNGEMTKILGYGRDELQRMTVNDLALPEDRNLSPTFMKKAIRGKSSRTEFEKRYHHKEGHVVTCFVVSSLVRDNHGNPLHFISHIQDVTARKRLEELAVETARLKSVADLSSGVAHHFNNLLQMVMGGSSLALEDMESGDLAEAKSYLKKMLSVVKRGAEMVERLQTFASNRTDITQREQMVFDVGATVGNAAELSKPLWVGDAEKRGIRVALHVDMADGCLISGQETEISEVIFNLLKNAAEALPHDGEIEVKTSKQGDEVTISVRDTGGGIPEKDLPHVFEPFWTTKGFELGKGMGLAVAHGLVKRHGGDISVESKVGAGTTFTVKLPLSHEPIIRVEKPDFGGAERLLNILVVEDEEYVATLLERILLKGGHKVFTAFSGQEGLAIFERQHVDLVLCDLGMPGMSGWEVGKAIRSICKAKGITKPPFVLLTGWGRQQLEKEKTVESGTDTVLSKPIASATLLSKVQEIVAGLE